MVLCIGIVLMTVYVTRATTTPYQTPEQRFSSKPIDRRLEGFDIYSQRSSNVFKKMFSQPSIWQGYQDYGADEITQKIYVKSINK